MRPITADDRELERSFIEGMSPTARRFRLLYTMKSPSLALLAQLTSIDLATEVAFVALLAKSESATEFGVARVSAQADGADLESAIAVGDVWQRMGLDTLLMKRLTHGSQERWIAAMHAIGADDNDAK